MVEYLDDEFFSSTLHYNFLRKQDGKKKEKRKEKGNVWMLLVLEYENFPYSILFVFLI
jgi:hypothetical protein